MKFYNLDVIISVGYRVKSKRGTQFRQWATRVLREHLVRGFTLNEKRLREQDRKLADLQRTVNLLEQTLVNQAIGLDEAKGLLRVITDYAYALTTLDRFDHGTLAIEQTTRPAPYVLSYEAVMEIVNAMKTEFGDLFGIEKDHAFRDGNKRIGAALFITFLAGNGALYRADGSKRIADNALVALTLLIAESRPQDKETIVKVIVSLINRANA